MPRRTVDQVFESLRITTEGNLAKCGHRQKPAQHVQCLLLKNRMLFVEIVTKPLLKRTKKAHISIEQMIDCRGVIGEQSMMLEVRLRNVIKITSAALRAE